METKQLSCSHEWELGEACTSAIKDDRVERRPPWGPACSCWVFQECTIPATLHLSHPRVVIAVSNLERRDFTTPGTESRLVLTCCKSSKSPKLGVPLL